MAAANPFSNQKPWHFSSSAQIPFQIEGYVLADASREDFERVNKWYQRAPVLGQGIRRVQIIHNSQMSRVFEGTIALLEKRHGNEAFKAKWESDCKSREEKNLRKATIAILDRLTERDPHYPHVRLVPTWHGTKKEHLESIYNTGLANLATIDTGYFGKGIYGTAEAEYAYRVYSKGSEGALLINWIATYSCYPVIDGDLVKLVGAQIMPIMMRILLLLYQSILIILMRSLIFLGKLVNLINTQK